MIQKGSLSLPCNCCEITDNAFTEAEAKADLKRFRRSGPANQTRFILEGVRSLGIREALLLDVGGGIGAIHHELLEDVAREAIHVDASSAYLKQARQEAERRGHTGRVRFIHADFTTVAPDLPGAEIVTLDRVVCCYPDYRGLLSAAAGRSRKALALTYPRETWYMRFGLAVMNFIQRLRGDPFRVFVHPVDEMNAVLGRLGFERMTMRRLFAWEMGLYRRVSAADG